MSTVNIVLEDGTTYTPVDGVDFDVDPNGFLMILDKVRTDHTARDIGVIPAGMWKSVQVNGLASS